MFAPMENIMTDTENSISTYVVIILIRHGSINIVVIC